MIHRNQVETDDVGRFFCERWCIPFETQAESLWPRQTSMANSVALDSALFQLYFRVVDLVKDPESLGSLTRSTPSNPKT
jgi:hypothetical protein